VSRLLVAALAAVAVVGAGASQAGKTARAGGYWIVLASDRDGQGRVYSVRPDGSRLTPLFARDNAPYPLAISGDGGTIAYSGQNETIFVSRANGRGFRRLTSGASAVLSRDGKRVAVTSGFPSRIAVIGADGRGRRPFAIGGEPDWAPSGKALVFRRDVGESATILLVQPLRGRPRALVRGPFAGGPEGPAWSPDGRWIAYEISSEGGSRAGLYLVRPDGSRLHRLVRGDVHPFAWSADGKRLAFNRGFAGDVVVVGVDGGGLRRLHLPGVGRVQALSWSPDGRRLALEDERRTNIGRIWVVGVDARGLRRVAGVGANRLVGWTRLAPMRRPAPPLPPSERVVGATAVETARPVADLSADESRVAFAVGSTAVDCDHVVVWTPAKRALARFGRPAVCGEGNGAGAIYDVELAGSRAAWAEIISCGNHCEVALESGALGGPAPILASDVGEAGGEVVDFHLHGDGGLLVFDNGSRLVRIGSGREPCDEAANYGTKRICTTLRRGAHAAAADSVSDGRIAVREPDAVAVLDAKGALVRVFPFGHDEVGVARLDGGRLLVARSRVLEVYDVATGAGVLQRPLPSGYQLVDVDGGVAVLRRAAKVVVLRLGDGRSVTLAPGRAPVSADLEPAGLYYSYATRDGGGRVLFMPRSELLGRLGS
jgi:hypothetical protein